MLIYFFYIKNSLKKIQTSSFNAATFDYGQFCLYIVDLHSSTIRFKFPVVQITLSSPVAVRWCTGRTQFLIGSEMSVLGCDGWRSAR